GRLRPSAPMMEIHRRLAADRKYGRRLSGTTRKNSTASTATVHFAIGSGYSPRSASYVVFRTPHSRWIIVVSRRRAREGGTGRGAPGPRGTRALPHSSGLHPGAQRPPPLGGNGSRYPPPHPTPTGSTR